MKLRTKRKIKRIIGRLLGVLIILFIVLYSYFKGKLIETCLSIVTFYIYRYLFVNQYHAKTMLHCFFITLIVLLILVNIELKFSLSILFSVTITFILSLCSYYVRDYLDNKILLNKYIDKINKLNTKTIENLTEDELIQIMPNVKQDVIHIVYCYFHKPKNVNAVGFAYRNGISEATLYRYVKKVKENYENLGNLS